jgi:hypothetical protein
MELRKEKQSRGEGTLVQLSNNHLVRDIAILCMLLWHYSLVDIVFWGALCVLKLWFPNSLSALGFLDFILSLSEIGYSHFGPVGHSHGEYLFVGGVDSSFSGFNLLVLSCLGYVGFLAHRNCEFGGGLVAFLWICGFASLF